MRLTDKRKRQILFAVYIIFVLKVIIFKYSYEHLQSIMDTWSKEVILEGLDSANFTLFRTINMYIVYADRLNSFENLAGNVVVFMPLGMFLPWIWRRFRNFADTFLAAFLFSLSIEIFQLFSAFGAFDVDDILLNCAGSIIGYLIYMIGEKLVSALQKKI
ncbi:MAG: VanZ family protein [Lachnospiraceae bacterium]|nr:VanZ family protein [Lachnospiraceae bacterium]